MQYYLLLVLIPLAAFAFASVTGAVVASSVWPSLEHRTRRSTAAARARFVAAIRFAPLSAGLVTAAAVAAAFVRFEPRNTVEVPGLLLWLGTAFFFITCALAARRLTLGVRASMHCSRLLSLGSRAISRADGTRMWVLDSQYPIAAVIGVFRMRLVLSSRLLHECTDGELDAIVGHERAHIRRRDNLVRAAMLYLPDPLRAFRAAHDMEAVWAAAAEEAADDAAAGEESERRTVRASALVRVARLATGPMPEWIGGLAFYEGQNLENRVRRLLDAGSSVSRAGFSTYGAFAVALLACALLMTEAAGQHLHAWMEVAVRVMP
jgi:beta-lactamase regulating signal transducer with metallopeptidase domain